MSQPEPEKDRDGLCRSEAESNKASCGTSSRERHGLEQEVMTAKAREAALSNQVHLSAAAMPSAFGLCIMGTKLLPPIHVCGHSPCIYAQPMQIRTHTLHSLGAAFVSPRGFNPLCTM